MHRILSPKQAALALGSSESTLKRWCDQGTLRSDKTPGGHRRIRVADLVEFARTQHLELVKPESIGLPRSVVTETGLGRLREQLECALLDDDPPQATSLLVHSFVQGRPLAEIGDQLIAPVMAHIGELWHAGRLAIYREHRATQILLRALAALDDVLVPPDDCAPVALGASPSGDQSSVAATAVTLVLRELGWNACYIGPDSPISTLVQAVADRKPSLFWMSVTHLANEEAFVHEFHELATQCRAHNIPIVMGGRALGASIRGALPEAVYCENLAQFASIARAVHSRQTPYAGGST